MTCTMNSNIAFVFLGKVRMKNTCKLVIRRILDTKKFQHHCDVGVYLYLVFTYWANLFEKAIMHAINASKRRYICRRKIQ